MSTVKFMLVANSLKDISICFKVQSDENYSSSFFKVFMTILQSYTTITFTKL